MDKKRENHFTKKDFLSENSKKCIDYVKNSFDPNAIPKEPNAYPQRVRRRLKNGNRKLVKRQCRIQGCKTNVKDPVLKTQTGDYSFCLTPETINTFKEIYAEKKDTLGYLEIFGSKREKAQAILIKSVALGSYN